jgi:hypothetical protein
MTGLFILLAMTFFPFALFGLTFRKVRDRHSSWIRVFISAAGAFLATNLFVLKALEANASHFLYSQAALVVAVLTAWMFLLLSKDEKIHRSVTVIFISAFAYYFAVTVLKMSAQEGGWENAQRLLLWVVSVAVTFGILHPRVPLKFEEKLLFCRYSGIGCGVVIGILCGRGEGILFVINGFLVAHEAERMWARRGRRKKQAKL